MTSTLKLGVIFCLCLYAFEATGETRRRRTKPKGRREGVTVEGAVTFARIDLTSTADIRTSLISRMGKRVGASLLPLHLGWDAYVGAFGEIEKTEYVSPTGIGIQGSTLEQYHAGFLTKWNPGNLRFYARLGYGHHAAVIDDVNFTLTRIYVPKASIGGEYYIVDEKEGRFAFGGAGKYLYRGSEGTFNIREGYGWDVTARISLGHHIVVSIYWFYSYERVLTTLGRQVHSSAGQGASITIPLP